VVGNWAVETHLRWAAIEQVVTTERHVLLYYGGSRAITIPLSAFGSPEEVERFVTMARQLHTAAMRQLTSGSDRRQG
jgi:YcxB-like protein